MVEGARLESVYGGNSIAGSNPAPSARRTACADAALRRFAGSAGVPLCGWIASAPAAVYLKALESRRMSLCLEEQVGEPAMAATLQSNTARAANDVR